MSGSVRVSMIAARARNGVIGRDGDLPWRLADDLAFFKKTTLGKPIVMGRKTWQSLPRRPLPGRCNIVLTRDWTLEAPGALVFSSLDTALEAAKSRAVIDGVDEVCIIGGEAVYALAIEMADTLYLTEVDASVDGDAVFPQFDEANYREVWRDSHASDDRNAHDFVIRRLDRIQS